MRRTLGSILVLAALAAPGSAPAAPGAEASAGIEERIAALTPALIEFRRDLHRHPELSGEERRTAGAVAARLRRRSAGHARAGGALPADRDRRGTVPGATNDPGLEARAREVVRATLGERALVVSRTAPPAFSEDFGAFQALAPGLMLWLGVSNQERGTAGMPHSPD